jgi:hypothetical protein
VWGAAEVEPTAKKQVLVTDASSIVWAILPVNDERSQSRKYGQ